MAAPTGPLDTHIGTRNLFSDTIRTLCGRTIPLCKRVAGEPTCQDCKRLKAQGKHWWY